MYCECVFVEGRGWGERGSVHIHKCTSVKKTQKQPQNHIVYPTDFTLTIVIHRPQNVAPNEGLHGATEAMDDNLSQEEGEEVLKKAANDPLIIPVDPLTRQVDNRLLEERGLTPSDIVLHNTQLAKYEADLRGKEVKDAKDADTGSATPHPAVNGDNRMSGEGQSHGQSPPGVSGHQSDTKISRGWNTEVNPLHADVIHVATMVPAESVGEGGTVVSGNGHPTHLVPSSPRVSHKVSDSPTPPPPTAQVTSIAPGDTVASQDNVSGRPPLYRGKAQVLAPAVQLKEEEEEEEEKEEGGVEGTQVSRAGVTFAVMQTEEKTHTAGEDEEGGDENATRAAPFTMASQWQGISALGSSAEEDSDDALDDGAPKEGTSKSRLRQLAMNTLADQDENLDSLARNSLVLLEDRDLGDLLRGSQLYEDEDSAISQLAQQCKDAVDALHGTSPAGRVVKSHSADLPALPSTPSPRKMPEKLAKDIGNRIGSPLRQSPGSPAKSLFKVRDNEDKKGGRGLSKLLATGKPPLHHNVKRDRHLESKILPDTSASMTTNEALTPSAVYNHLVSVVNSDGRGGAPDAGQTMLSVSQWKPLLTDSQTDSGAREEGSGVELKSILKSRKAGGDNQDASRPGLPVNIGADLSELLPHTEGASSRRASVPADDVSDRGADKASPRHEKEVSPSPRVTPRIGKMGHGHRRSASAPHMEHKVLSDIPECVSPINLEEESPVPRPPPGPPRTSVSNAR